MSLEYAEQTAKFESRNREGTRFNELSAERKTKGGLRCRGKVEMWNRFGTEKRERISTYVSVPENADTGVRQRCTFRDKLVLVPINNPPGL